MKTITQRQMMAILERRDPYNHRATVWQKLANGRIVRLVNWGWKNK